MPRITIEEPTMKTILEKQAVDIFQDEANTEEILRLYDSGIKTAVGIARLMPAVGTKKISAVLKDNRPDYLEYCAYLTGKKPVVEEMNTEKELIGVLETLIKTALTDHQLEVYKNLIRKD